MFGSKPHILRITCFGRRTPLSTNFTDVSNHQVKIVEGLISECRTSRQKAQEMSRYVDMFGGEVYNETGVSMIEQLRELTQMKNDGALTADEFARFKDKLVNAPISGACACAFVCARVFLRHMTHIQAKQ